MIDLIVKNGKLIYPEVTLQADLAIDQGKIVAIGSFEHMQKAERVIDATGKFVLPGCIDPHVHIHVPFMGATSKDDFDTATISAAIGGITTVIDFAFQKKGATPIESIKARKAEADGKVAIDYSLHANVTSASQENIQQIKEIVEMGIPSFKVFMVYREEGLMLDDGNLMPVLQEVKKYDGLVGFHTENAAMIEYLRHQALKEGKREAIYHALTRPNISEAEAIHRALFLTEAVDAPIYDFHMSVREGVDMFRKERSKGRPAYAETLTQYLTLTKDKLKRPDGANYICSPPLRDKEDCEALWQGLADGTISTVASDQGAFTAEDKKMCQDSFEKVPNGIWGMEFRLPILFSEGVLKGRISMNRLVALTSTNVAKIFGLYPMKGTLSIGSDADITILDPRIEKTLSKEDAYYGMDWCPYEGMKVKGYPVTTILRGQVIVENGQFKGRPGEGRFLKREIAKEYLGRPLV